MYVTYACVNVTINLNNTNNNKEMDITEDFVLVLVRLPVLSTDHAKQEAIKYCNQQLSTDPPLVTRDVPKGQLFFNPKQFTNFVLENSSQSSDKYLSLQTNTTMIENVGYCFRWLSLKCKKQDIDNGQCDNLENWSLSNIYYSLRGSGDDYPEHPQLCVERLIIGCDYIIATSPSFVMVEDMYQFIKILQTSVLPIRQQFETFSLKQKQLLVEGYKYFVMYTPDEYTFFQKIKIECIT